MDKRKEIIQTLVDSEIGSLEEIEDVIKWTFHNVNKATSLYSEIELSGLGSLLFNKRKSLHYAKELTNQLSSLENRKLAEAEKAIEYINKKNEQTDRIPETNSEGNS